MGVPIFEFVFPSIRDDGETLQSFYDQIPHIIEDTFIGAPGMHSVQVAKVLDTKGTTPQKHIGMALVLSWDDVSSFQAFVSSPKFVEHLAHLKPLAAGPPDLKLYQSPKQLSATDVLTSSAYLQVFKVRASGEGANESGDPVSLLAQAWSQLQTAIEAAVGDDTNPPAFFSGNGIGDADGIFLGFIGWKTQQDMVRANSSNTVTAASNEFLEMNKNRETSLTTMDLQAPNPKKE